MSQETGYNGWKNYETWAVNLWLTNDERSDRQLTRMAESAWENRFAAPSYLADVVTPAKFAISQLGEALKLWVEDMQPDLGGTLWADLLGAALSEVDWRELAENALSEFTADNPDGTKADVEDASEGH